VDEVLLGERATRTARSFMQRFGDFFGENHDSLINQHLKKARSSLFSLTLRIELDWIWAQLCFVDFEERLDFCIRGVSGDA